MSPVSVYRVKDYNDNNVKIAADILAAAFSKDPFHLIAVDYDQDLNLSMVEAAVRASFISGEAYFAEIDGKVVGSAHWFGPGRAPYDTEEGRQNAAAPHMARLPPKLKTWNVEYFRPAYQSLTDKCFGPGYKLASYHLQSIGVLPEYQKRGVTRALIDAVKVKALAEGIPMCLEAVTELNSKIYARIGFHLVGEPGMFKGPNDDDEEFTFFCMVYDVAK